MRISAKAILGILPMALLTMATTDAAQAAWTCQGPAVACSPAKTATSASAAKTKKHMASSAYGTSGGKKYASGKSKKHYAAAKPARKYAKAKSAKVAAKYSSGGGYQAGIASWYGGKFHGRTTANGEKYNMWSLTAAHRTLPFGTKVRVTNTRNGNSVVVRINDRGPFIAGRIIDLSRAAASQIGINGVGRVQVTVLGRG